MGYAFVCLVGLEMAIYWVMDAFGIFEAFSMPWYTLWPCLVNPA